MINEQHVNNIRCIKNSVATHSCLNQKCQKYAIVCGTEECQCRQQHENCLMVELRTIVKSIKAKVISTKQLEDCIDKGIEKLIDQLSDFRDQTLIKVKNEFQFWGVSQSEKLILLQLTQGKIEGITGSQMWQAHLNFKKQDQILKQQQQTMSKIKTHFIGLEFQIEDSLNSISKLIKQLHKFTSSLFQVNQKTQQQNQSALLLKLAKDIPLLKIVNKFMDSSIIKNVDEKITISYFMFPKFIKSCKLLYKASQNNFDVSKFHKTCDNIPNTLIICETEFDKKIGGYTPIPWKTGSNNFVKDDSGESFVFSLSHRDKFILQNKDYSVQHWNDQGPYFGNGSDLYISQWSNQNRNSSSYINSSYVNNKYKKGDKESFQRFNGNPQGLISFKVKEWEVWQIQFQT